MIATEFTVKLVNRPGALADVTEILGDAAVSIAGGAGLGLPELALLKVVVDRPDEARKALDAAGISYSITDVLELVMPQKAGMLAHYAREVASAGINIESFYVTLAGKVIVGVDKLEPAQEIAREMGFG